MHPCVHSLAVAKGKRVKALLLNRHPANAQSKGAVLWEKGTHSASTLDFILSSAQRTTHVPAFLRKQIAPYLADNGVPAEPAGSVDSGVELDESSGQRVAASRPPAPSGSVVSDAGGARNALSAGHALDEDQATAADSMLEQPMVSNHAPKCVSLRALALSLQGGSHTAVMCVAAQSSGLLRAWRRESVAGVSFPLTLLPVPLPLCFGLPVLDLCSWALGC